MKKIAIIGYGYVGKAFYNFFSKHYECMIYDPYIIGPINGSTKDEVNTCDLAVICTPTPQNEDGSCNISSVEETIQWLSTPNILIKSTVEVGTTKMLIEKYKKNITFSPEFAGETKHWTSTKFTKDVIETPFFIFGTEKKSLAYKLIDLYMPITGPDKTYHVTDTISAEMVKYVENSFFSTKVAFCNEMYELCEKNGTNWNEIRELWLLDPRNSRSHTSVFPENRGFGGKCLPKDTNAIVKYGEKLGVDLSILKSVLKSNEIIKNKS